MARTRKNRTRGWKSQQPSYHQRTNMMHTCGKKCFLGPGKTYPICTKNTCKVNRKGVYAALIRSRQYHKQSISKRARNWIAKH